MHMDFIVAAAMLRATNYGIVCPSKDALDFKSLKAILDDTLVPTFTPKQGVTIQVTEPGSEDAAGSGTSSSHPGASGDEVLAKLRALPPASHYNKRLIPISFEKDDDRNFHVEFITAAANLRAFNYGIPPVDRHRAKGIAGKIIPAIATTTAFVAGLVSLELTKILQHQDEADACRPLSDYKNAFANLALPLFTFSEPISAPKLTYNETSWTLWDRFEISADLTLTGMIQHFSSSYGLEVTMASHGRSVLFGFIRQKEELARRMAMPLRDLIPYVTKHPILPHISSLILDILACDKNGEDVEVPYVAVHL
jgi:ubiquitin-activating enzyme E1